MHALNNIIERPQLTLQFMEESCQNVCAETGEETSVHESPSGDWSLSVLGRVLELTVPPVLKLVTRPVIAGDWDEFVPSKDIRGILVNVNHKHWIALTKVGLHAFLVDSQHWPRVITEDELRSIISSQPAAFSVVPHDFGTPSELSRLLSAS